MKRGRLYLLACLEGATGVTVELIGGKMLAPVFGSSIYIWTSVIGVTLFSLTIGYLTGGILSSRRDLSRKLFFVLSIGALTACCMPLVAERVFMEFLELDLFLSCVLMSLLLLAAPLICLGASSSLLIQLSHKDEGSAGRIAGRFYAISTVGGILATFTLGFFIIPSFGIRIPLFVVSAALILATWLVPDIKTKTRVLFFIFFTGILTVAFFFTSGRRTSKTFTDVYESEGIMGQLKVVDYWSENNIYSRALLTNNSAQSIITKTNVTALSQYNYVHFISALATLKPEGSHVLLLGMAGGSLVYELQKQGFHVDVVDIDERMFYIAERYFYFQKSGTDLFTDDARHYIRTTKRKYDIVIIDISSSELQPSYLYTTECFNEVKQVLNPEGFFFVNFQGVLEGNTKLASATWSVYATLRSSGFHTYYYSFARNRSDDVQFLSSPIPINFRAFDSSRVNLCCTENVHVQRFVKMRYLDSTISNSVVKAQVLVDDKPLLEKMKFETITESRNTIRKDIKRREGLRKGS